MRNTGDIDLLPDGVVIAGAGGIVTTCNAVAMELLGVEGAVGRPIRDVMAVANFDGVRWYDFVRPFGGLTSRRLLLESSWYTTDGRELLLVARLHRPRPGGRVDWVAVALRDARSRTRIERERSDLVATVAHELRSPLTGVKGFTSTLLSKWDRLNDSQRQLMLQTVDADADRLTRLIEDLLDVARIDTGRLSVRPREFDLAAALRGQIESLVANPAADHDVTLDGDREVIVWADPDRLAQVVGNLVENASRHGRGPTAVAVHRQQDGGAELLVDDAGEGIPDDIRRRIFNKFWRQGGSAGSGLGLYIVHGIVSAHGGSVSIETSPLGGARMRVALPPAPA
jgi:signal transduction histidine kinase